MARRPGFRTCLCPALRRVDGVRITVTERGSRAEVVGVGHRHPSAVRVSMALAARLVAEGAPLTIRRPSAAADTGGGCGPTGTSHSTGASGPTELAR